MTQLALTHEALLPALTVETLALATETVKIKHTANKATTVFLMSSPFRSVIKKQLLNFINLSTSIGDLYSLL
jgi:hypothetical protein